MCDDLSYLTRSIVIVFSIELLKKVLFVIAEWKAYGTGRGFETITIGDKRIGIWTSVLEEKATACNMLCCYADELKEGFYPWVDQVCDSYKC